MLGREVVVLGCGSVGLEVIERIVGMSDVGSIWCVDSAEIALSNAYERIRQFDHRDDLKVSFELLDLSDKCAVEKFTFGKNFDSVYLCAAYKHVRWCEISPGSAWRNNTMSVINSLENFSTKSNSFVFISTDKAVFPTTVMGKTKRMGEILVSTWSELTGNKANIVRFGNVLASSGSVIPIFKNQIAKGGPITVTSTQAERYFMSLQQAAYLVVEASQLHQSEEPILLPHKQKVRILDLARFLVLQAGYLYQEDNEPLRPGHIRIDIVGLGVGEKEVEALSEGSLEPLNEERVFFQAIGERKILPEYDYKTISDEVKTRIPKDEWPHLDSLLNCILQ